MEKVLALSLIHIYLKKSSQEPVQTPEEQPKEPAEDTSAETQTPAEEPREEPKEETPKEEPPKEEAKKEYFKLVNPDEIDFSQYTKIQPASTEENSVKQSESYDYSSKSVVDGDEMCIRDRGYPVSG